MSAMNSENGLGHCVRSCSDDNGLLACIMLFVYD